MRRVLCLLVIAALLLPARAFAQEDDAASGLVVASGENLKLEDACLEDSVTVEEGGTLALWGTSALEGTVINYGTLIIAGYCTLDGDLDNYGSFEVYRYSTLDIYGNLYGAGDVRFSGEVNHHGYIQSDGNFVVTGHVATDGDAVCGALRLTGGTWTNTGELSCRELVIEPNSVFTNNQTLEAYGPVTVEANGTLLTLNSMECHGTLYNRGRFTVEGYLQTVDVTNSGTILCRGDWLSEGAYQNNGYFRLRGQWMNTGEAVNSGLWVTLGGEPKGNAPEHTGLWYGSPLLRWSVYLLIPGVLMGTVVFFYRRRKALSKLQHGKKA